MEYLNHLCWVWNVTMLFYVNSPSYFQQWILNSDISFPKLSVDLTFGFWIVGLGLCVFPSFFQFTKECEIEIFEKRSWTAFQNIPQFTKKFENWDFCPLTFIFGQMVRLRVVFQYDDMGRQRGVNLSLN